jgi:hypothetical protein
MLVSQVALGDVKDYAKVNSSLTEPPAGYHSCHGVKAGFGNDSDFKVSKKQRRVTEYEGFSPFF